MTAPHRPLPLLLSLGAAAGLLSASLGPLPLRAEPTHHHPAEAGEATASDPLVVLAQMQGHLLVATELLAEGEGAAAEPHVGHPVAELYPALQPALNQGRIRPFLPALEALHQQVRLDPAGAATGPRLAAARAAVAAAIQELSGGQQAAAGTVMAVVRELAAAASEEYGGAVAGGRVVEVIEYQDSRGFLLAARQWLGAAAAADPAAAGPLAPMGQTITAMLQVVPTAVPPSQARATPAQMEALKARL